MSDSQNDRKDFAVGDPEGEWDAVVRRLSDRIRRRSKGAPTTQTSLDLAGELVRLERRAREAESVLEREREVFALRVREMEDKLRKLDPWLRQLKVEYQKAASERDRLKDELERAHRDAPPPAPSSADLSRTVVIEAERLAALREAEAAHAARQAAVAEAESLKKRIENEKANVDSSANERVAEAEKARDQAIEDAKQLRTTLGESRKAEEEVRRLAKQLEALEATTAAQKAVARAARESLDVALARVAEMESAQRVRSQSAEQAVRRVEDITAELDRTKSELTIARRKLGDAESAAAAVRGAGETIQSDSREKARAIEAARADVDQAARTIEKLRAETSDAKSQAERTRVESSQARDELAQALAALDAAKSAGQKARDEAAAAQRDAAEATELSEEAMRSEEEARRRTEDLAAKLASAAEEIAAASARAHDLASEAELLKGRVRVLENDAANLNRTLEDERQGAVARFDAAEASWRSQMRAAESRFDADIHREREHAREVEEVLRVIEARHGRAVAEHDDELTRIRTAAMQFISARSQDLVAGIHRIVGDDPIVVPPITMSMDPDANQRTPTATVFVAPTSAVVVPPPVTGEWDRLMSGVEQLWSEVEGIRHENATERRQDTASMTADEAAAVVASTKPADTASVEPDAPPEPPVAKEPPTIDVDDSQATVPADAGNGKRKKKRR